MAYEIQCHQGGTQWPAHLVERDAGVRILQKATVAVGWLAAAGGAVKGMGDNR